MDERVAGYAAVPPPSDLCATVVLDILSTVVLMLVASRGDVDRVRARLALLVRLIGMSLPLRRTR